MTVFVLKIIACISMFLDHVKYAIPETTNYATMYLGRIAFPIFAFLISEGYIHTSNLKKYIKRLSIFAMISQIPFMLFRTLIGEWLMLNIMFTLLLGLCAIIFYDKIPKKYISIPLVLLCIILGKVLNVDYGWFGVALVFIFYLCKNKKVLLSIIYLIVITIWFYTINVFNLETIYVLLYFIAYIIPLVIIMFYNGKQGKKIKYFLYCFYPIHMLVLYLLSLIKF